MFHRLSSLNLNQNKGKAVHAQLLMFVRDATLQIYIFQLHE